MPLGYMCYNERSTVLVYTVFHSAIDLLPITSSLDSFLAVCLCIITCDLRSQIQADQSAFMCAVRQLHKPDLECSEVFQKLVSAAEYFPTGGVCSEPSRNRIQCMN